MFLDIRFPTDISVGSSGGPEFSTSIASLANGFEKRNINWIRPRNKYNVSCGIQTREQFENVINFFKLCQGRARSFRFKDWTDYQIKNMTYTIKDNEAGFQLQKSYTFDKLSFFREITKPIKNSVKVSLNNEECECDIDYNNGFVTLTSSYSAGTIINYSAEFDVHARFDNDALKYYYSDQSIHQLEPILLIEVN